ncbi:MAG: response regulator, partial [Comamonas sp.]
WGHEVALAYEGYAGLEVARSFGPDVALLDIGLPTMTGYELARKLRRAQSGELFLVAVTGYGQPSDVTAAKEAGFDMHVVKPLNMGQLQRLLAAPHLTH